MLDDLMEGERLRCLSDCLRARCRMYKVKTMLDRLWQAHRTETGHEAFWVQMLAKESARFKQEQLRQALVCLADLDYGIKSGLCDPSLALPETLAGIYAL